MGELTDCTVDGDPVELDACVCAAFKNAGNTNVGDCGACIAPFNATFAQLISNMAELCASTMYLPPTCVPTCAGIFAAATNCAIGDSECFCPAALKSGDACSICMASANPTGATDVGNVVKECLNKSLSTQNAQAPILCYLIFISFVVMLSLFM